MNTDKLAEAIVHTLTSPNEPDRNLEPANVVDGLYAIARGLHAVAASVDRLGTNGADTNMGAIELLASEVRALRNREPTT